MCTLTQSKVLRKNQKTTTAEASHFRFTQNLLLVFSHDDLKSVEAVFDCGAREYHMNLQILFHN